MFQVPNQVYTAEFKVVAAQQVRDGQGMRAVTREFGMSSQALRGCPRLWKLAS